MKLEKLFEFTNWTETQLAQAVGVSQPMINKLRRKNCTASIGLALRIEKATLGKVKAEDVPLGARGKKDLAMIRQVQKETQKGAA